MRARSLLTRTNSVSGALWNTILPRRLRENLPEAESKQLTAIFRSLKVAQSFEVGTPMRVGIDASYRQTQQVLAIASVSISVPLLLVLYFVKNVRLGEVDKEREEKGKQWLEGVGRNDGAIAQGGGVEMRKGAGAGA